MALAVLYILHTQVLLSFVVVVLGFEKSSASKLEQSVKIACTKAMSKPVTIHGGVPPAVDEPRTRAFPVRLEEETPKPHQRRTRCAAQAIATPPSHTNGVPCSPTPRVPARAFMTWILHATDRSQKTAGTKNSYREAVRWPEPSC